MLFVRSGWKEAYDNKSDDDRAKAALRHGTGKDGEDGQRYAGVSQEQNVLDWLHDCYFSSVAGDAPAFEAWPTHEGLFTCSVKLITHVNRFRLPSTRVHLSALGYAPGRDARSREARANMSREEPVVFLLHLGTCKLSR
jgi:hypothetical protein